MTRAACEREVSGETPGIPSWKRALDLAVIALLMPALLLVGGLAALLIKCGSRGPVFFRQSRVGHRGRLFTLYKFRTMRVDADTDSHRHHVRNLIRGDAPMRKLDRQDPRLIPLGAWLRASGIDELPQVINVLRCEMSLIGPRPCVPYEFELHQPWQRRRFDVLPGLTGLWQVSGKNSTTFERMIELDLEYARRCSMWLDLKIIARTVPALWSQCREVRDQRTAEANPPAPGLGKSAESYHV